MFEHVPDSLRDAITRWREAISTSSAQNRFIVNGLDTETRVNREIAADFFGRLTGYPGPASVEDIPAAISETMILEGPPVSEHVPVTLGRLITATSYLRYIELGSGFNVNHGINRMPGRRHDFEYDLERLMEDIRSGEILSKVTGMIRGRYLFLWSTPFSDLADLYHQGLPARRICDILGLGYEDGELVIRLRYGKAGVFDERGFRIPTVLDAHSGGANPYFRPAPPDRIESNWTLDLGNGTGLHLSARPANEARSGSTVDLESGESGRREWVHPSFDVRSAVPELPDSPAQFLLLGNPSEGYLRGFEDG